jgi:hypothetical protein
MFGCTQEKPEQSPNKVNIKPGSNPERYGKSGRRQK